MAIHCFYHSADLDGHCSGALVKYFRPSAILHPINYGEPFPWGEIKPEDAVYVVDFCLQPYEDMERLVDMCEGLTWIDHHKTALDAMAHRKIYGVQEIGKGACELTWEWFAAERGYGPHLLVTLLGRYDVWDHTDPRTLPLQYRLRMEDLDPSRPRAMDFWEYLFECDIEPLVKEGTILLRYADQENTKYARAYAFETKLEEYSAVCVNRGMTNSKVFDSVYNENKHHLMITFCRLPPHKQAKGGWTVSLYSTRDDIDCGAIAKTYGGGGHKGAAGFQCDTLPFPIGGGA